METNGESTHRRVGLIYDERMCKHFTPDDEPHPENPNRIRAIWSKLQAAGIPQRFAQSTLASFFLSLQNLRKSPEKTYLSLDNRNTKIKTKETHLDFLFYMFYSCLKLHKIKTSTQLKQIATTN